MTPDRLEEMAQRLSEHIVGTVAWPFFRQLDADTSAKEQDRLYGRILAKLREGAEAERARAERIVTEAWGDLKLYQILLGSEGVLDDILRRLRETK